MSFAPLAVSVAGVRTLPSPCTPRCAPRLLPVELFARAVAPEIDCDAAMRRLWDYVDARLPAVPRREVDEHLDACERGCPAHVAFARAIRRALAGSRGRGEENGP